MLWEDTFVFCAVKKAIQTSKKRLKLSMLGVSAWLLKSKCTCLWAVYVALTAVAQRDKAGKLLQISWIGEDLTEEHAMHTDMHDEVVQINQEKEALSKEQDATKAANCTLQQELLDVKAELSKALLESVVENALRRQELFETREVQQVTDECCVCLDASKQFMFTPCGHRCVCKTCASDIMRTTKECPICRAAASCIIKVFL